MRVQRDGRLVTVTVTADGDENTVSHAGAALLAEAAERVGLTRALSSGLAGLRQRQGKHDPGRVVRDLAVILADGGDAPCDLRALREQPGLFGAVASDPTAYASSTRLRARARPCRHPRFARLPLPSPDLGHHVGELFLGLLSGPAFTCASERHVLPLAVGAKAQRVDELAAAAIFEHRRRRGTGHQRAFPSPGGGGRARLPGPRWPTATRPGAGVTGDHAPAATRLALWFGDGRDVRGAGQGPAREATRRARGARTWGSKRSRARGPCPRRTAPSRAAWAYTHERATPKRRATSAASTHRGSAASAVPRSSTTRRATASIVAASSCNGWAGSMPEPSGHHQGDPHTFLGDTGPPQEGFGQHWQQGRGKRSPRPADVGLSRGRKRESPPEQDFPTFPDGRGGFRTCDLSRVKRFRRYQPTRNWPANVREGTSCRAERIAALDRRFRWVWAADSGLLPKPSTGAAPVSAREGVMSSRATPFQAHACGPPLAAGRSK